MRLKNSLEEVTAAGTCQDHAIETHRSWMQHGETTMQTSETVSDTGSPVTLQTSVAGQTGVPTQVVQQVPVQQQVQQVQTIQQVQHVYPAQVQYVEGSDTVYTNGTM
ncbi:hypothetical protein FKM82_000577 [Ascaphus truei]